MAEMERIAGHLGALGAVGEAAGFLELPARCGHHREALHRAANLAFGHRLMMDCVIPGGIAADVAPNGPDAVLGALADLAKVLPELEHLYERGPLARWLSGIGVVSASQASRFAAGGVIGRAAGRDFDARRFPGYGPYGSLALSVPVLAAGDADARTRLRLAEIAESIRLLRALLDALPPGPYLDSAAGRQRRGRRVRRERPRRRLALVAPGPWPDRQRVHAGPWLGALAAL